MGRWGGVSKSMVVVGIGAANSWAGRSAECVRAAGRGCGFAITGLDSNWPIWL